jgi:Zn-dependent metalloprotease
MFTEKTKADGPTRNRVRSAWFASTPHDHGTLCCILPPYLLAQIAINGSEEQRRSASNTLTLSESLRSTRSLAFRPQAVPPSGPMQRRVYDAHNLQTLPGELVRAEGADQTDDVAVNEAYDGLSATYDLYADIYGRNSIDDAGMDLLASVHFDVAYDNAFWDGTQMVFGDGDGELFNRFTISLDVIGHELTHGVTEMEAGLVYLRQSGALNEHVSDVFGSLVKQYAAQESADEADWLIGGGLLADGVQGVALRSMRAPGTAYDDPVLGKDPQPANTSGYVRTMEDNGGVHINSGIPNHAFYLAATALGGYAWEKAGEIWYATLLDPRMPTRIGFRGFAALTIQNAGRLYGPSSDEQTAVREAWAQVGVAVGGTARGAWGYMGAPAIAAERGVRPLRPWEAGAGDSSGGTADGSSGDGSQAAARPAATKSRRARSSR